ncbi:MAG: hypothetical protein COZ08_09085 [Bacteroidetes bacterium CG_4_10_14_3_um_filter_42_6]|nr:MAG: hypothetical protein COZ08_09085 [Bacteroidetes bacterium CG_4_10_14_3_um_filter_42_6]
MLAAGIQIKVWKKQQAKEAVQITFNQLVKDLLALIESTPGLSVQELKARLNLSKYEAEELLSDLIVMRVIRMENMGKDFVFHRKE